MFNKKNLLGVGFTDERLIDILEYIDKTVQKREEKFYVVTPNPEILVIANKNFDYKKVLKGAKLALIDGIGVIVAGRLLGVSLKHRISGIDFVESACKYVAEKPITVGFLGAGPHVAEKTAECLNKKYPGLKVAFSVQEWKGASLKKHADILFVAFGSPKQEIWISEHLKDLPVTVAVGVGGAFDMISGKVRRAPVFVRAIGLEWLFRLLTQPWRIGRQFRLLEFGWLVLREKFSA